MDPKISAVQKSTSSAALKAAVDGLPRDAKYYTAQVRDVILQKQQFIVDSPTADSVISFLRMFTDALLRTPEIRDLNINILARSISDGDAVANLGAAICGIVQDKPSAELYSTPESLKAILSYFHRATTAEGARWIAASINNIVVYNPSSNKLINNLPVVEAFSAVIPHATSDDAIRCVSKALQQIVSNNEAQKMFGIPTFFELFKSMEKFATSVNGKASFKKVVDFLQPIVNRRIALEHSLRDVKTSQELTSALTTIIKQSDCWSTLVDLLLSKQHLIQDEEITISTAEFISLCFEENEEWIQHKEIYQLFKNILLPKSLNFPNSIHRVHQVLADILWDSYEAQEYFSTPSIKEYIIASLPHSDESFIRLLDSLLFDNKEGQEIFGTPEFFEQFKSMEKFATWDDVTASFQKVVGTLQPIVNRIAMEKSLRDATTSQEVTSALDTIIKQSDCRSTLVDVVLSKQHLIQDEESTSSTAQFINLCFEENEKSIQKKEIYELFQNILLPKSLNFPNTIPRVHEVLSLILWDSYEAQEFFSTTSFKEYIIASLPHSNESVLGLLDSLLFDNKEGQEIFGTPEFFEQFKSMEKFASADFAKASFNSVLHNLRRIVNQVAVRNTTTSQELTSAFNTIGSTPSDCKVSLVDLLLSKQHLVQDEESTTSTTKFVTWCFRKNQKMIRKKEIYELFQNILLLKSLNFPNTIPDVREALALIVKNKESQEFFSTPSFKEYIIASLPHSNESVLNLLNSLLVNNKKGQEIFGTPAFLEKYKLMGKFATSDKAKASFKAVVDTLQPIVNRRVPTEKSLDDVKTSLQLTSALNTIIKQSDCWSTLVDLLLSKQHLIQDEESTISTAKFIKWCCDKNEKSIQKTEIYQLFQNILLPKSLNFPNSIPHVHEALALIVKNKEAQEFFSTTSFKEYIIASLPHSNESVLKLLNSLLVSNKKGQEIFGTPDFKKKLEIKFVGNASQEFKNVVKILTEHIVQVRFDALKKLVADHNEEIDELCLKKLAENEIDVADLLFAEPSSLAIQLQFTAKQNVALSRLVQKMNRDHTGVAKKDKDKNTGVAPIHQDPFKGQELDKLRRELDDLRKLHQDMITSTSKSIEDLKNQLKDEKTKLAAIAVDRDAKSKKNDDQATKIDGLEKNLADELQKSSELEKSRDDTKKQLQTAQQQNATLQSQLDAISPFVRDKFYQIDSNVNNLPPPQAGVVERHPVAETTRIFAEAQKLMKKGGALIYDAASPVEFKFSAVQGFTLQSVDVILRSTSGFEDRLKKLQGFRSNITDKFNPAFAAFLPEQQQVLKVLFEHFLPRPPNANKKQPNLVNVFHGTRVDRLDGAMDGLRAMRETDKGFFGLGVYATTSIEYAAQYARGDHAPPGAPAPTPRADGCYPVLWCVAAVGVCNPVSRADDYSKNRVDKTFGPVSNFFGSPLSTECDCHCAIVGGSQAYQAVPPKDMEYMEIVVDQEAQVIPIAVLWVKP